MRPLTREHFSRKLLRHIREKGIRIAGLPDEIAEASYHAAATEGLHVKPQTASAALAMKEDADGALYASLVASVFELERVWELDEAAVVEYITHHVPETCIGLTHSIIRSAEQLYGPELVKSVLLVTATCRCTLPELQLLCEGPLGHARFSSLPFVVFLRHTHLVEFTDDASVVFTNAVVEKAVLRDFPDRAIDKYRAEAAMHHLDVVRNRRHGFARSFGLLADLLLHTGQVRTLSDLLLDAVLLDDLSQHSPGAQITIFDAFWRACHDISHLRAIMVDDFAEAKFRRSELLDTLHLAVDYFVRTGRNVWQAALSMPRASPLFHSAVNGSQAPYPAMRLLNRSYAEQCSVQQCGVGVTMRHCSMWATKARSLGCTTSTDGVVTVWDINDGSQVASVDTKTIGGFPMVDCGGATLCDDSRVLLVGRNSLAIWEFSKEDRIHNVPFYTCSLRQTAVLPDGSAAVVVNTETLGVSVMSLVNGKIISDLPNVCVEGVREAHFIAGTPDVLLVGAYEMYRLREEDGSTVTFQVPDALSPIRSARHNYDGNFLACCSDTRLYLFNSKTGDLIHSVDHYVPTVVDVVFHPNAALFGALCNDGHIYLYLTLSGQLHRDIATGVGEASWARFTPDSTKLVARCGTVIRMWDGTTLEDLGGVVAHDGVTTYLCLNNSQMISTGASGGGLKVWDFRKAFPSLHQMRLSAGQSKDLVDEGKVSQAAIQQVALSPSGDVLAVLDAEGTVTTWLVEDLDADHAVAPILDRHTGVISSVAFHHSDALLFVTAPRKLHFHPTRATGRPASEILMPADIDAHEWMVVAALEAEVDGVACMAHLHHGCRVVLVDAAKNTIRAQHLGHRDRVTGLVFSNEALITSSLDATVCAWSLHSSALRCEYTHDSAIQCMIKTARFEVMIGDASGAIANLSLVGTEFQLKRRTSLSLTPKTLSPLSGPIIAVTSDESTVLSLMDAKKGRSVNYVTVPAPVSSFAATKRHGFLGMTSGDVAIFRLLGV